MHASTSHCIVGGGSALPPACCPYPHRGMQWLHLPLRGCPLFALTSIAAYYFFGYASFFLFILERAGAEGERYYDHAPRTGCCKQIILRKNINNKERGSNKENKKWLMINTTTRKRRQQQQWSVCWLWLPPLVVTTSTTKAASYHHYQPRARIRNNERFHVVSYARTIFRKYFMEFLF